MTFRKNLLFLALLLAVIGLAAGTAVADSEPELEDASSPSGVPSVTLQWPLNGSILPNHGDMIVYAEVSNFKLVDKTGKPNADGQGHILYFIDEEPPTAPGVSALTEPGSYFSSTETSHTWRNVSCGQHTFSVELVNNDNTPLNPPVVAKSAVALHAPE